MLIHVRRKRLLVTKSHWKRGYIGCPKTPSLHWKYKHGCLTLSWEINAFGNNLHVLGITRWSSPSIDMHLSTQIIASPKLGMHSNKSTEDWEHGHIVHRQLFRCFEDVFLSSATTLAHDDVIKLKHSPRYWPFVRGIHRSPVNFPHKSQWRGALTFSLICVLNKRLSKQLWDWWFETQSWSLWWFETC